MDKETIKIAGELAQKISAGNPPQRQDLNTWGKVNSHEFIGKVDGATVEIGLTDQVISISYTKNNRRNIATIGELFGIAQIDNHHTNQQLQQAMSSLDISLTKLPIKDNK